METLIHDPAFWVLVAFVGLMAVFVYLKVPGTVGTQLDKRSDQIESDIREAEKLREEAQDLLATYERKQKEALREAEDILANAKSEAERMGTQGKERLEQVLARREKQALDRIAQVEAQATEEVRHLAVDIAMDATRELVAAQANAKGDAMVDAAIGDLAKKLH
jgi:F-type H+-transporting ATPase subunit b